jgi:hypothetical protein
MNFLETLKEFKLAVTTIAMIVSFIISGITLYADIHKSIDNNTLIIEEKNKQIELTQISILKSQIRELERYPCKTSRDEWGDYNMLFSQYHKLMKKHNPLLEDLNIKPMERLTEDSCKCYKGAEVGCSE